MRVGPAGQERPAVLVDQDRYVDVSDAVDDYDEQFFAGDGLSLLRAIAAERITAGQLTSLTPIPFS